MLTNEENEINTTMFKILRDKNIKRGQKGRPRNIHSKEGSHLGQSTLVPRTDISC
jgi:hypothetical protein